MSEQVKLQTGDKVEIVDRSSPHYRKVGIIIDMKCEPVTMIDHESKPLSYHDEVFVIVELDGISQKFNENQIKKVN